MERAHVSGQLGREEIKSATVSVRLLILAEWKVGTSEGCEVARIVLGKAEAGSGAGRSLEQQYQEISGGRLCGLF